jgi:hypothetical protein
VTGTPDGVIAGSWPLLVVVADGFVIGRELGFTIGDDVGFGFGLEFGLGVGVEVTGVGVVAAALIELPEVFGLFVAAAGLPPFAFEFDDDEFTAEALFEFDDVFALPLVPVDPVLPPCDWAKETADTEPISSAAIVLESEIFISPPCCHTSEKSENVREQVNQNEQAGRNAEQPGDEVLTHISSMIDK